MQALEEDSSDHGYNFCLHLNCFGNGDLLDARIAPADSNSSADTQLQSLSLAQQTKESLAAIEALIWRALGSQGRSEARLWLCTRLGSLRVPRQLQISLFLGLMRQSPEEADVALSRGERDCVFDQVLCRQVINLACQKQPRRVMRLFSKDSKVIRSFFSGHPKRILWWFEKFSRADKKGHELGAQALAHFAFIHRDKYWNELEWKGTHGQAPATVASKPHYFLDLDVLKTVENFLDNVPAFWRSDELWDSLKEGDILSLDMNFFVNDLCHKMSDGSPDVWQMLESFLSEETFSVLCLRLLSFVSDKKLFSLLTKLSQALYESNRARSSEVFEGESRLKSKTTKEDLKDAWLMQVLMSGEKCPSLDCAIMCNACAAHARQLIQILKDEEKSEEISSLNRLLLKLHGADALDDRKHWALLTEGLKWNKWEFVKLLALESWSVYFLLAEQYTQTSSIKALLSANSIKFQNCPQDLMDEKQRGLTMKDKRRNQKSKKKKKKRRKYESLDSSHSDYDDYSMDESATKWYLSTNDFRVGLDKTELPEHLASHAFGECLKWAFAHW